MSKKQHECKTYVKIHLNKEEDALFLEKKMNSLSLKFEKKDTLIGYGYYLIGVNEEYEVNINDMIRKTIKPFLGKEKKIKKLVKMGYKIYLEIVPTIFVKSKEVTPILSIENDIIEFLYKSGIEVDLDYYML